MPFWNKKTNDKIIMCTICEWNPDGEAHWACSCGHSWNTFDTKGKCPKCKIQWEVTFCPGCGQTTPHKDWYKTKEEYAEIERSGNQEIRAKKKRLESRLIEYGIKNHRVSHLPYLDHTKEVFQSTYEAGCRMMILYSIGYAVHTLEDRPQIIEWLKAENIWERVSPIEKDFFKNPSPEENLLTGLSWRIEGSMTLGWCLNKLPKLPRLDVEDNDAEIDLFQNEIPGIGDKLTSFLTNLEFRDLAEIYEENLLNELATTYFRDLMFNGKKDNTQINRLVSFERHKTLNWLRTFMGIAEWDKIDTST